MGVRLSEEEFERIVAEAIDTLPERFLEHLNNVAVLVADFPTREQMKDTRTRDRYGLLGLFEGHGQASRQNFGPVLPDRITIFRQPIIQSCETANECRAQIISTVKHEIAHHFGSDEPGARRAGRRS